MSSEVANVYSCEDDFFCAVGGRSAGHLEGLFDGGATAESAGHGYGTVGAEIVAAVLYFEEGACAVAAGIGWDEVFIS